MHQTLLRSLGRNHRLYVDLVGQLTPDQLRLKLGDLPSNRIGQQLWCVVSARHSTNTAVRAGQWQGFTSVMSDPDIYEPAKVLEMLESTHQDAVSLLEEIPDLTDRQVALIIGIIEHEAMHQGQLIRYLYGHGIERPESWKRRYSLT